MLLQLGFSRSNSAIQPRCKLVRLLLDNFRATNGYTVECQRGKTLGNLLSALNPELGEAYSVARWHYGTTGLGHNCGAPKSVAGML